MPSPDALPAVAVGYAHPPVAPPHNNPPVIDPEQFRRAFRSQASAVAVITAAGAHGPVGFTATSLTTLSAQPPTVCFNIAHGSSSWPAVAAADHLGVHLLDETQEELAATFARSGTNRFAAPTTWQPGPHAVPLLHGCLLRLVAAKRATHHAGDHAIITAHITWADSPGHRQPLIHHDGSFTALHKR
ncbi:MAG TPA: flavin reductase family protein [Kineosporiaceae bacterium]|nr:flavin reductase family protein [Kineosporiaceae bacterium]